MDTTSRAPSPQQGNVFLVLQPRRGCTQTREAAGSGGPPPPLPHAFHHPCPSQPAGPQQMGPRPAPLCPLSAPQPRQPPRHTQRDPDRATARPNQPRAPAAPPRPAPTAAHGAPRRSASASLGFRAPPTAGRHPCNRRRQPPPDGRFTRRQAGSWAPCRCGRRGRRSPRRRGWPASRGWR